MLALQLAEVLLLPIVVLFADKVIFKEKNDVAKTLLLMLLPAIIAGVAAVLITFDEKNIYVLSMALFIVSGFFVKRKSFGKLLYCGVVVHILVCSGSRMLFFIKDELRIIISFLFSAAILFFSLILRKYLIANEGKGGLIRDEIVLGASLLAVLVSFSGILSETPQNVITGMLYALLALVMILCMDREEAILKSKSEIEQYKDNLSQMYETMRLFKHNYKNVVIGVKGCLKEKNYDELEQFIGGLEIENDDALFKQQMAVVSQLDDASVKWLMIAKLSEAQKQGVNTSLVISKHISFGKMKKSDFTVILGNFLDNAIEAASESENKLLKIAVFNKNGDTIVSIKNTYGTKPVLSRLFDKGYTEKEGHSGLGLYGVKKIVDSYSDVLLDIRIQNTYFTVDLNISGADGEIQ